jgi:hypothetical protein
MSLPLTSLWDETYETVEAYQAGAKQGQHDVRKEVRKVTFMVDDILTEDTTINRNRLDTLQHLIASWSGVVRPVAEGDECVATNGQLQVAQHSMIAGTAEQQETQVVPEGNEGETRDETHKAIAQVDSANALVYAKGRSMGVDAWFVVQQIKHRAKKPQFQVKFLRRARDGVSDPLVLPSPRVDWVMEVCGGITPEDFERC